MGRANPEARAKATPPICPKCKLQKVKVTGAPPDKCFGKCLNCKHEWQFCGCLNSKRKKLCGKRPPFLDENGRCHIHGSLYNNPGTPIIKGTYSKFFMPRKWHEDAVAFLEDKDLAGVRNEIALVRARMNVIRLEIDGTEDVARQKVLWEEHDRLQEDLRKLAKDETQRERYASTTLSAHEIVAMRAEMLSAIEEVVSELTGEFRKFADELARQRPDLQRLEVREGPIRKLIWERFAARYAKANQEAPALGQG